MTHILIALALQVIIAIPSGNWWAGAAAGAFHFIGREMAQAEERYIDANGGSRHTTPHGGPAKLGYSERMSATAKGRDAMWLAKCQPTCSPSMWRRRPG